MKFVDHNMTDGERLAPTSSGGPEPRGHGNHPVEAKLEHSQGEKERRHLHVSLPDMPAGVLDLIFSHLYWACRGGEGGRHTEGTISPRDFPCQATIPLAATCSKLYAHYRRSFVTCVRLDMRLRPPGGHRRLRVLVGGGLARFSAVECLVLSNRDALAVNLVHTSKDFTSESWSPQSFLAEAVRVNESECLLEALLQSCSETRLGRVKRLVFSSCWSGLYATSHYLDKTFGIVWAGRVERAFQMLPNVSGVGGDQSLYLNGFQFREYHPLRLAEKYLRLKYLDIGNVSHEPGQLEVLEDHVSQLRTLECIRLKNMRSYPPVLVAGIAKLPMLRCIILQACGHISNLVLGCLPASVESVYLCATEPEVGAREYDSRVWERITVSRADMEREGIIVLDERGNIDWQRMCLLAPDGRDRLESSVGDMQTEMLRRKQGG